MLTAVDKVKKGKGRTVNARFAVMCAHYLFDADFCNVASGWEKGVVEKNVIAGGASGSTRRPANGAALKSSTPGWEWVQFLPAAPKIKACNESCRLFLFWARCCPPSPIAYLEVNAILNR